MGTDKGIKLDNGKIRLGLVLGGFAKGIKEVGCIGTFGADKYCENGWQSVENGEKRYTDALFRHLFAWLEGEEIDPESGYRHLAHAAWNCLAVLTLTHLPKFLQPRRQPVDEPKTLTPKICCDLPFARFGNEKEYDEIKQELVEREMMLSCSNPNQDFSLDGKGYKNAKTDSGNNLQG